MGLLDKSDGNGFNQQQAARQAATDGLDTVSSLMWRVFNRSLAALAVMSVAAGLVGWLLKGRVGLLAAVVGLGVLFIFCLTTPVILAVLSKRKITFTLLAAAVLGSWVVKVVIIIAALLSLRSANWFDHTYFAVIVMIEAVVIIGIEVQAVLTSHLPYVNPDDSGR